MNEHTDGQHDSLRPDLDRTIARCEGGRATRNDRRSWTWRPSFANRALWIVAVGATLAIVSSLLISRRDVVAAEPPPVDPAFKTQVATVVERFCLDCHRGAKAKGGLDLAELLAPAGGKSGPDFAKHAGDWQNVVDRLSDRSMPPRGKPQPSELQRNQAAEWITKARAALDGQRRASQGRSLLRRLNRIEYDNTLRDLLGCEASFVDLLPEDGKAAGFDNVDAALELSSTLLERYFEASDAALDAVFVSGPKPTTSKKTILLHDLSKAIIAKGKAGLFYDIQTRDDCVVYVKDPPSPPKIIRDAAAPVAGRYRFRVTASSFRDPKANVSMRVHAGYAPGGGKGWLVGVYDVKEQRSPIEFTLYLEKGESINICANGVTRQWNLPANYEGPGLAVYSIEVEGPLLESWPPSASPRLFGTTDLARAKRADVEPFLRRFVARAYRRPVTDADLRPLLAAIDERLARKQPLADALRVAMSAVLCSPDFLFLRMSPGKLSDHELASRLSYFLWSSMPDDALVAVADKGELRQPNVLRAQVERMLDDPKASAFTTHFTGQWLGLRQLTATDPDARLFPEYDPLLEYSMPRETMAFFDEILKHDRSVLEFVDSDWSMLNARLADHYGIPGVKGTALRKVALPAHSHRGGVMTQAAILKLTANGTTTSPVVRGVWVLDRILGQPAPPPPQNVSAIEPDIRGAVTIRQQLAKHRADPGCASCHSRIDPPGFALESFDPIGGWRERYRVAGSAKYRPTKTFDGRGVSYADGPTVECADVLPDGTKFADVDSFRKAILRDKDQIARNLAGRLLVYATGHALEPGDRVHVEKLVAAIRSKNYGFRTLVHEVVQSEVFLAK